MANVMQGDQYYISFTGTGFAVADVDKIEFTIGKLTKIYPGIVTYDSTTQKFLYPITQAETFLMRDKVRVQVRVHFPSGDVIGADAGEINIRDSLSKVVL